MENLVLSMFFAYFGLPVWTPGPSWSHPGCSMLPIWLQAVLGSFPVPSSLPKIDWKMIKDGFQLQLKAAFSHEASSKKRSRKPICVCYFIFFKILKVELSPTQERDFGCFQNCIGRICWVRKRIWIPIWPTSQASSHLIEWFWKCPRFMC